MIQDYYKKLAEGNEKDILYFQNALRIDELIISKNKRDITYLIQEVNKFKKLVIETAKERNYYKELFNNTFNYLLKFRTATFFQKFMFVFFGKDIK